MANLLFVATSERGISLWASTSNQGRRAQKAQDTRTVTEWTQEPDECTILASVSVSFLATEMPFFFFSGRWQKIGCVKDWTSYTVQRSLNGAVGSLFLLFEEKRQCFFPSDDLLLLRLMFFSLPIDLHWTNSFFSHCLGTVCLFWGHKFSIDI